MDIAPGQRYGYARGLRDVGGGGAEQRHNETRECVVVLMTPVSGVLYRASALIGGGSIGAPDLLKKGVFL